MGGAGSLAPRAAFHFGLPPQIGAGALIGGIGLGDAGSFQRSGEGACGAACRGLLLRRFRRPGSGGREGPDRQGRGAGQGELREAATPSARRGQARIRKRRPSARYPANTRSRISPNRSPRASSRAIRTCRSSRSTRTTSQAIIDYLQSIQEQPAAPARAARQELVDGAFRPHQPVAGGLDLSRRKMLDLAGASGCGHHRHRPSLPPSCRR